MLFSLAEAGKAPALFARLSSSHVPAAALIFSAALMIIGVIFNYLVPAKIFGYVISIDLVVQLSTWAMIIAAHLGYQRAVKAGRIPQMRFRLPGAPYTNWIVLVFLATVAALLAYDEHTRIALYVGPVWFMLVTVGYFLVAARKTRLSEVT
jgi:AAT family amino acid transporter/D-serine/D-alanine/glycine transporter